MSKEAAPAVPAADETAAKKSSPVPLIAAIVAGLAVGGGTGAFVVGPALAAGISPATVGAPAHARRAAAHGEDAEDEASADEGEHDAEDGDEAEEGEAAPAGGHGEGGEAASTVHVIDNLVLNPAGSGGTRFLLLTIAFEMKTAALTESMKTRDAEVRDHVLAIIGGRTVEQLSDITTREALKTEIVADVGRLLRKKTAVKRIYFPQFVLQ